MGKNHILKKHVLISTVVIALSFLLLGVVLVLFMSNYWKNDKTREIMKNMRNLTYIIQNNIEIKNGETHILNIHDIQGIILTFSENNGADIILSDVNGNIITSSHEFATKNFNFPIPKSIIEESLSEPYSRQGNLGGLYRTDRLVVSCPVEILIGNRPQTVAIAFAVVKSDYVNNFLENSLGVVVTLFSIVSIVSAVIIGFLNYKTLKPLKQMTSVANRFAKEDFSARVVVQSDDEIGQLAEAFNNMAESLSVSENVRRSFIANVSHELKTPMTTISGFVDGIIDDVIPQNKQKHYLSIVSSEIKRLSRLVSSMLNLSRIDSGNIKTHIGEISLLDTITNILFSFEKIINDRNIVISGLDNQDDKTIEGDIDMLYQVMYNLIENAVKFTPENGYINFELSDNNEVIEIKIKNSGQGISQEDIPFIFDRFYKTDKSRSNDKKGLGLGLYIVKKIVTLHGGKISVSSVYGRYCEFCILLPKKSKFDK